MIRQAIIPASVSNSALPAQSAKKGAPITSLLARLGGVIGSCNGIQAGGREEEHQEGGGQVAPMCASHARMSPAGIGAHWRMGERRGGRPCFPPWVIAVRNTSPAQNQAQKRAWPGSRGADFAITLRVTMLRQYISPYPYTLAHCGCAPMR